MGLVLTLLVIGCESEAAPFEGSAPSLEALAGHVLDALSRQDLVALDQVRLTEREHNEIVWPELPASAPEVNFPVDVAWGNIQTRNASALRRIGHYYKDLDPSLVSAECRGEAQAFETFQVLTDCWVSFELEGALHWYEAQLFKDVLVRGGGYKVFRYYDEGPRSYRGRTVG